MQSINSQPQIQSSETNFMNDKLEQTVLVFPDLRSLWTFAEGLRSRNLVINTSNKTLSCFCDNAEISIAVTTHKAIISVASEKLS